MTFITDSLQFLWNLLINIYALFALLPFVTFMIVLFAAKWFWNDTKKAVILAGDVTNVFLIGVVSAQFDMIFPESIGGIWLILLFLLIAAGLLGGAQSRLKGEVNIKRLVRIVWRLSFLVLALLYILFSFIIIIKGLF